MVRTIVIPDGAHIELEIPPNYIGKKVEVSLLLLEEIDSDVPKKKMSDFWGILSDKTANELHEEVNKSRGEWERDI